MFRNILLKCDISIYGIFSNTDAEEEKMPFCPNCGREVRPEAAFCPSCGYNLKSAALVPPPAASAAKPSTPLKHKSPGIAAVLALVPGLFGLMGIGHIYVGRVKRGISLLVVGIILAALSYGSILLGLVAYELGVAAIVFGIILLILWIWQILNAYSLAKQFNKAVEETGKEPW
jgi:hypothetical protein